MMSRSHKVEPGDTLGAISVRYLGSFSKWQKIVTANPQLSGRRKMSDSSPAIYPGDILAIPDEDKSATPPALQTKTIELSDSEQDISIVIDGYKFLGFTGYELNLSYDSFDTFSFTAPFDIASKAIADVILPFAFKNCEVYYNGTLKLKGTLLTPDSELTGEAKESTLQVYPLCGILNDCTVPLAQYPGLDIKQIAEPICEAYGIKVLFDGETGEPLQKYQSNPRKKF
jgi:hypothetical protein